MVQSNVFVGEKLEVLLRKLWEYSFTVSNGKVLTFDGLEKRFKMQDFLKQEIHFKQTSFRVYGEDL